MGGVINGQLVNSTVTNAAFIFKNADDVTLAKLGLNDQDPTIVSGSRVDNSQREFNAAWSFIGGILNQAKNYLPTWLSNAFGSTTDTIKQRIEAIDAEFGAGGQYEYRAGRSVLPLSTKSIVVTFSDPLPDALYVVNWCIQNNVDSSPIYFWGVITAMSTTGFTVVLNTSTDTVNYSFHYSTRKIL